MMTFPILVADTKNRISRREEYWKFLKLIRSDMNSELWVRDHDPTVAAEQAVREQLRQLIESKYGIRIQFDHRGYVTEHYKITDEAKYLVALLRLK